MVNLGPLAAEIISLVWDTQRNFNGFRVLAAFLHGTLVMGVSQTLRRSTEGATYIRQGGHHVGHWPTFLVVTYLQFPFLVCFSATVGHLRSKVHCPAAAEYLFSSLNVFLSITSSFNFGLESVNMNQHVKSHFVQKLLPGHTNTHGEPIALPGPLNRQ